MERRDVVRLVSRALSVIYGVIALAETTYLPERLLSYVHYTNEWRSVRVTGGSIFLPSLYRVEVGLLLIRIAMYLTIAVVFWKCGPWVERTLLPEREQ
jgi:hypothetical protein